mgnify:CR=1 FL=1
MSRMAVTFELDSALYDWIKGYQVIQGVSFSDIANRLLEYGKTVELKERPLPVVEMPKEQKLLIQCVVQSLLILQDQHVKAEDRKALQERSKELIQKTLGLT